MLVMCVCVCVCVVLYGETAKNLTSSHILFMWDIGTSTVLNLILRDEEQQQQQQQN